MHGKCPASFAPKFDLAAGDSPIAQDAHTLVVERMPLSAQIARLENGELIFWKERCVHLQRPRLNRSDGVFEIGAAADVHIGKTPKSRPSFHIQQLALTQKKLIGVFPTVS
jgi:hypothetical protein